MFLVLAGLLWSSEPRAEAAAQGHEMAATLTLLREGGFPEKSQAVDLLVAGGDPDALAYLQALLDGRLYQTKPEGRLVVAEAAEGAYRLSDPQGGASLGQATDADLAKITINNALRTKLKAAIARLSLNHPEPRVRLAAVSGMLERLQPESVPELKAQLATEQDPRVREALEAGLSLADLGSDDRDLQLAAIAALSGNLTPAVRNRLGTLAESQDQELAKAARRSLASIEGKVQFYQGIETLFFGLSLGSVLVLAAIGLAITFGVMGVINMAHGELMMLGAYTTYLIQTLMPGYLERPPPDEAPRVAKVVQARPVPAPVRDSGPARLHGRGTDRSADRRPIRGRWDRRRRQCRGPGGGLPQGADPGHSPQSLLPAGGPAPGRHRRGPRRLHHPGGWDPGGLPGGQGVRLRGHRPGGGGDGAPARELQADPGRDRAQPLAGQGPDPLRPALRPQTRPIPARASATQAGAQCTRIGAAPLRGPQSAARLHRHAPHLGAVPIRRTQARSPTCSGAMT